MIKLITGIYKNEENIVSLAEDYKRNFKIKIPNWELNDLIEENDCDEEDDYANE